MRETSRPARVAVVTGAASGLGEAVARALSAAGMRVGVLDRDGDRARQLADELGGFSAQVDVSLDAQVGDAFQQVQHQLGPVSCLVNCAGIAEPGSVVRGGHAMALEEFKRVVDVNLIGTLNCIRHAVPQMIAAREGDEEAGVIINTSSIAAFDGQIGQAAYAASKGGVAGMVLPLARELGDYGIRVVGIAPGVFETPMTLNLPPKSRDVVFSATPEFPKRPGKPSEYADLVMAIVRNPMLNGEVIRLDGGLRMPARL